jgi:hypothetical protein
MPGFNMDNATPGLGRLAAAIGGGGGVGGAYQKGMDNEMSLQSKLAQALASIDASRASARLHGVQADEAQGQLDARRPEAVLGSALTANGIPTDEGSAVADFLRTGALGGKYRAPADGNGPVAPAPDWQDKLGTVARSVGTFNQAVGLGDKSVENLAKAEALRRGQQMSSDIIAGKTDPTRVAQAEYAISGKAPYAFHEFGTGNNLTGAVDASGAPAQNFAQYRQAGTMAEDARAGASKASAASSYASAEHSRALTQKTKQDTELAGKGVLRDTDQGLLLVDPRTGSATPVMGPNGQQATKAAPPAKALPASAAKGFLENQQNLRQAQKALDLIQGHEVGTASGDGDATGMKGYLPNVLLNKVDPRGVDTRAALADIGSLVIHDRSGAAVSATEFPRLQPFVPSVRDDAATAQKKLKLFVQNYKAIVDDQEQFYRESGYNVPKLQQRNVATTPNAPAAPAAGGGFTYLGKE